MYGDTNSESGLKSTRQKIKDFRNNQEHITYWSVIWQTFDVVYWSQRRRRMRRGKEEEEEEGEDEEE